MIPAIERDPVQGKPERCAVCGRSRVGYHCADCGQPFHLKCDHWCARQLARVRAIEAQRPRRCADCGEPLVRPDDAPGSFMCNTCGFSPADVAGDDPLHGYCAILQAIEGEDPDKRLARVETIARAYLPKGCP